MSSCDVALGDDRQGSPHLFLREFVRNPLSVASVVPSSDVLARRVAAPVPATGDPVVVELGPGTGAFTAEIQRRLDGRGRHVAVEVNDRFARWLAGRYPSVEVVTGDARQLVPLLAAQGADRADVIVSGLPWAVFPAQLRHEVLGSVLDVLAPHGAFTTFAYIHARWATPARELRRSLEARFEEVVLGRTVWANLPPALVYHCRRPRRPE